MVTQHIKGIVPVGLTTGLMMVVAGCNSPAGNQGGSQNLNASQGAPTSNIVIPTEGGKNSAQIGNGCHSDDGKTICLALKYVTYTNHNSTPVVSQAEVLNNLQSINRVWSQCGIQFQIDKYLPVNPELYNLEYATSHIGAMDSIRASFADRTTLLVVTTGSWSGGLGSGSANAWTQMPGGDGPFGAILEASVGTYANIIGHELGHYLGLDHVSDSTDLMNPVIYDSSTSLDSDQCVEARSIARNYWKNMLR